MNYQIEPGHVIYFLAVAEELHDWNPALQNGIDLLLKG